jgi:type II secretory pathway pseudopilin PulG
MIQHRPQFSQASRRAVRGAFTLVEVAVALAIFVLGALAILRIFPPALGLVRGSENRSTAGRMSRSTVSAYELRKAEPPLAIVASTAGSTFSQNWVDFRSPITNQALTQTGGVNRATLPAGPTDDITQTTLGQFKRIVGEIQVVRRGTDDPAGNPGGFPYVVTKFPYTGSVEVYTEDEIEGVRVRADGYLDFSNATLASDGSSIAESAPLPAVFTTNNLPTPPAESFRAGATFYVSYRWAQHVLPTPLPPTPSKRLQGVVEEPIKMEQTNALWTPAYGRVRFYDPDADSVGDVLPGAVKVRVRKFLGTGVSTGLEPRVGLVHMDQPSPAPPLAIPGQLVSLDYDVTDWRNIVVDETPSRKTDPQNVTADTQWNVLSPMRNIDAESGIFTLFARPNPAPNTSAPVLGLATWNDTASSPGVGARVLDVNTAAGRVTYDIPRVDAGDPIPAAPTRTVFRGLDGWAHQLSVAARSYYPFSGGATPYHPREPWREYLWYEQQAGATPGTNAALYFQASEAGKLVMVSYQYDGPGGTRTVSGAIVPISGDLVHPSGIAGPGALNTMAPASGDLAPAQLLQANGQPLPASQLRAVLSVQGVSVTARTAWVENGRYTQVVTKGYRPLAQ